MNLALVGFQDRDFRLSPVTFLPRLRRLRPDLDPASVDRRHHHRRGGSLRIGESILLHEGKPPVRRDGRVTLVDPLPADLPDQPLDRLGSDSQVGQFGEIARRLLIGNTVHARMNDFLLHTRAEAATVKAQRLILREKKPADSGGNWRPVVSRRHRLAWL
jgi:hypothetical protein